MNEQSDLSDMNFITVLQGNKTADIPVWFMRQAGRYLPEYREVRAKAGDFLNLCYTPELAAKVTLQPIDRFNLDAAIIFSDILVVPHAMGQAVWFEEGEGPRLEPIQSINDLPDFHRDKFLDHLKPVFEALSITRQSLHRSKALIGFSGAPWTLACYMVNGRGSRDYQNVRRLACEQPGIFGEIIGRLVEAVSIYLIEKIRHGADALQIFDSHAGVLSENEFNQWVINPTMKIVKNIQSVYPHVPIIGFPRQAGYGFERYIDKTGVDCISLDSSVPLTKMKDFQKKIPVQGNLDPLLLLGNKSELVEQALEICDVMADRPFIFNLGHGMVKETDPGIVALLVETIKNYGTR